MKTRYALTIGISAALAGAGLVGIAGPGMLAVAGTKSEDAAARAAAKQADQARKAMTKRKFDKAVIAAEAAVRLAPRDPAHRALLGQVYLAAGRFQSAKEALTDALALDPANGRAALNLSLAQTALGDWTGARATLDAHKDQIGVADMGLAMALAGDPVGAVTLLSDAARQPTANATVRQNLALALALSGRWQEAKAIAGVDLAPAAVDARIMEWAAFARPKSASDQVAALLGVVPVADGGQPVQIALAATVPQVAAVVQPVDPAVALTATDPVVDPAPAPALVGSGVVFAARTEVVQPLPVGRTAPVAMVVPKPRAVATKSVVAATGSGTGVAMTQPLAKGGYFVQVGAYESAAIARDAWVRATRRSPSLASHTPSGMSITTKAGTFYRLSVGGFARGDADKLCGAVRAKGGACFVRAAAGETAVTWGKRGAQVAGR